MYRRIGCWIILSGSGAFCSSTMKSPDVLRFDMFCISSRVRQLKYRFYGLCIMVRSSQNRCGLQVRVASVFVRSM